MTRDLHDIVREAIRRDDLIPRDATVVVGFSGGPDSTALLAVLRDLAPELGATILAAHVDHALREDSALDAAWTREHAAEWGIPYVAHRIDWAPGGVPRANIEARAREARYDFLRRVAAERSAIVAVGHHADDRVETVLAQWIRGAGPRGLSAPRARREDGVVRPLLGATRDEILAFLRSRDIPFLADPTNADGSNLRARLRRDVVPALRRESPDLARVIGRSAALFADVDDFIERESAAAARVLVVCEGPREIVLDGPAGRLYHRVVLSTVLRNAIRRQCASAEAGYDPLERLVRAWQVGGREAIDLCGGVRVSVGRERVVVASSRERPPVLSECRLHVPGVVTLEPLGAVLRVDEFTSAPRETEESDGAIAWLDAGSIRPPLRVRARRPGDRYRPAGLGGSAKIQDLLVDRKVPRHVRDTVPLVVDAEGIVWVVGFRVDERARISERTGARLRLRVTGDLPWTMEAKTK
jgi:tRNA(Ile)-lysidine synthase